MNKLPICIPLLAALLAVPAAARAQGEPGRQSREIDEAALCVVDRMRFTPARIGGKPVRVRVTMPVTLAIDG